MEHAATCSNHFPCVLVKILPRRGQDISWMSRFVYPFLSNKFYVRLTQTFSSPTITTLQVISAQQLPRPRSNGQEIVDKTIVDPFVEISIHTPEWLAHPFRKADELHSSALSGKTKHVMDNGFNPIWEQELNMNWEQLGGKEMRDCVFVKFTVKQKGKEGADDEPLGIYCASLGTLNLGEW